MKKNKILIGVISIMFAGIITLGIIECNNSNTKDNDKLFIGNGKFCQAKRLNGLGAIYDDDYAETQLVHTAMIRVKHMLNLVSILFSIVKYTNVITKVKLYQVKIGCMVLLLRQNREKRSLKILFQLICHQN